MRKKYKLNIPDMTRSNIASFVAALNKHNREHTYITIEQASTIENRYNCHILKDWLEEVKICKKCGCDLHGSRYIDPEICTNCFNKKEPITAEEYWRHNIYGGPGVLL